MPIYEVEVGGKTHEIESDSDLSDAQLGDYAKKLAAPEEKPPSPAAMTARPTPTQEKETTFGERIGKELRGFKDFMTSPGSYEKSMTSERKPGVSPHSMETAPGGPMLAPTATGTPLQGLKTGLGAVAGAAEVPIAMGAGAGMAAAGGFAGAGRAGYKYATEPETSLSEAAAKGGETAEKVMGMAYQPRTAVGKLGLEAVSAPLAGAAKMGGAVGGSVGRVLGNEAAGETIGETLPALLMSGKAAKDLRSSLKTVAEKPLTQEQQAINKNIERGFRPGPGKAQGNLATIIESLGGEKEITRKSLVKNQAVADAKTRKSFNLPEDAYLTTEVWDGIREKAGKPYEAVRADTEPVIMDAKYKSSIDDLDKHLIASQQQFAGLGKNPKIENLKASLLDATQSKTAAGLLDTIKSLRADATRLFRSTVADEVASAYAYRAGADALEGQLDRHFSDRLASQPMQNYRAARKDIAASYDAEAATNPETGHVDAAVLGRLLKKGRPLSGELREVAEAALTLPNVVKSAAKVGGGGVHVGDVGLAGILSYIAHTPKALSALLVRPIASSIASSKMYAKKLGTQTGKTEADIPVVTPAASLTMSGQQRRKQDETPSY